MHPQKRKTIIKLGGDLMKSTKKQFLILLLAVVLSTPLVFTGCQKTEPITKTETDQKEESTQEETTAKTVKITDMNGRELEIPSPQELKKVYFPSPLAQLMIYTIDPDKMVGVVSELSPDQLKFMPKAEELQVMGNFDGGKKINPEQVLATGAQVFISMGPMELSEKSKQSADELQKQLKIPVIVVDGQFDQRAEAYRFLGRVFGEEERCEELAKYCEETFKEVQEKVQTIPEDKRVTLYYAEKENGLATEPDTSSHAAVFKYAGAKNVANVENTPGSGMTPVTLEQILVWNPDVIFMGKGKSSPYNEIITNKNWGNIKAVKDGRVYEAPNLPFSWIDRPPSSQQYLGLRYVANVLYPEVFPYDMSSEVQKFFKLFYQVDLTTEEAKTMLGGK